MEIKKIKIGSNIYDIKDSNAVNSSDVTKLINNEIYGSETKPSGATVVTSQNITTIAQGAGFTVGDNDTKNTAGASNTASKIYLVGATALSANPVTYSNDKCYAEGGYLYTNGSKATTASDVTGAINLELYGNATKPNGAYAITTENLANAAQAAGIGGNNTDTKNTTGATNTISTKLFLVGSAEQSANPQTYTNVNCYIGTDNSLYTNGIKTVNSQDVADAINTELYGNVNKPSGAYAITNQNLVNAIGASGISTGGVSTYYQLGYAITSINGSGALTIPGTDPVYVVTVSANISSVVLDTNPPYGHSCHVIFKSSGNSSRTITISHDNTNRICPNASEGIVLTVPAANQGYVEVDFLNAGNSTTGDEVYVRGF